MRPVIFSTALALSLFAAGCVHDYAATSNAAFHGSSSVRDGAPAKEVGSSASAENGRKVYGEFCGECHGTDARGNGPRGQGWKSPPADLIVAARRLSDEQLFATAARGRGNMPAWTDVLTDAKLWSAIHYVRSLAGSPDDAKK